MNLNRKMLKEMILEVLEEADPPPVEGARTQIQRLVKLMFMNKQVTKGLAQIKGKEVLIFQFLGFFFLQLGYKPEDIATLIPKIKLQMDKLDQASAPQQQGAPPPAAPTGAPVTDRGTKKEGNK